MNNFYNTSYIYVFNIYSFFIYDGLHIKLVPFTNTNKQNHDSGNNSNNDSKQHHRGKRVRRRREKKGIRPVLHRLNAKLRNRNRRGRDRSRNRQDDSNRENNKYDGAMSELPTITNLTLDI